MAAFVANNTFLYRHQVQEPVCRRCCHNDGILAPRYSVTMVAHHSRAANCAIDFATQRAVQQLLFTFASLRDETSCRWLDEWAGDGLLDTHVCDALRLGTSDRRVSSASFFRALFNAPTETLIINKPVAGRGGSTATNPYLQHKKYFTYAVDIEPPKFGRMIFDVRLAIAEELASDLRLVSAENERIWRCFRAAVEAGDEIDIVDALDARFSSALFDASGYATVESGTPYREANYDLALNYTLHCALVNTMEALGRSSKTADVRSLEWLRSFCQIRATGLLLPPRGIRRAADAFMAALLSEAPRLAGQDMLDPMALAEQILDARLAVVEHDWIPALAASADFHLAIRRELLEGNL
jgi:hypothetical protein